jgi:hypothetical protein
MKKLKTLYCQQNPRLGGTIAPEFSERGVSINAAGCNQHGANGPDIMYSRQDGKCLDCLLSLCCLSRTIQKNIPRGFGSSWHGSSDGPKSENSQQNQLPRAQAGYDDDDDDYI